MALKKALAFLVIALGASACSTSVPVSRNTVIEPQMIAPATPAYSVVGFSVDAPESLRVSEANSYYPMADVVWRGDAYGNRLEQIEAIFEDSIGRVIPHFSSGRDVTVQVEIERFHSLTERTRYTFGGSHSIKFNYTLRDANTGVVLDGPRLVVTDLEAYGGQAAIVAESRGETQKVRISRHLVQVIGQELARQPVPEANETLAEAERYSILEQVGAI
ncbi:DUF6778 family protein [Cochlodiniinecator piscidefendens]|uniref:DUF6778 family protein n=1 Tax=Cochlodiniinecator piscidefendens TaxID=2715756 RepID=UPI0014086948|nr:DUF6778 family protein [Cochlodiniinecator piscidefendens]